jgi:hypothetical protein
MTSTPFAELLWPVPRVLAWIAFRESACVEENWRAASQYPEQSAWPLREADPQGTLLRALENGSLRALKDSKEWPREAWANATGHSWPEDVRFRREDVLALWPAHRERLLALATTSGKLEPVAQRNLVTGLIRESLWSRACTPIEILQTAFGDPEGRRYWECWLFEPLHVHQFADLLAVHRAATEGAPVVSILGVSMPVLDGYLRQIIDRLRAAAEAGETWFVGDTSCLLAETWPSLALRSSALAVRPREAIAWLYRNPNARHLLPTSVTSVLCDAGGGHEQTAGGGDRAIAQRGRGKSQPTLERARGAIKELYPDGVPSQTAEPNKNLCRRVGEKLKQAGLTGVSDDTILRAAGRRQ